MSFADRDTSSNTPKTLEPVEGLTGAASDIKALLAELSTEIEESRRRQGHALLEIQRRLHAIETGGVQDSAESAKLCPEDCQKGTSEGEPWDRESAEALSDAYEAAYRGDPADAEARPKLQSRFADIAQHIARTLSDIRPQAAVHALGQKLEHFHAHVSEALDEVARRSDVGGLRLIESHVIELGHKLADVQAQLQRLDSIEANLRTVMDEIAGERLVRLSEHQDVLADVIDSTAARTAEHLHQRLAEANALQAADAGRFEALRSMIEEALLQQRQAAASATDALSHISVSTSGAEPGQIDDLKSLVESSMAERRRSEQDAMAMLGKVQQAVVQVLDRIDALDGKRRSGLAETPRPSMHSFAKDVAPQPAVSTFSTSPRKAPITAAQFAAVEREAKGGTEAYNPPTGPQPSITEAGSVDVSGLSPVERMRREFIEDARRAKLKAAAGLLEGANPKSDTERSYKSSLRQTHAEATSTNPIAALRAKLFGVSPKLLASALVLIVAINGGLLFMSRKSPAPPIEVEVLEEPVSRAPMGSRSQATTGTVPDGPETPTDEGQRSETLEKRTFAADDLGDGDGTNTSEPMEAPAATLSGGATAAGQNDTASFGAMAGSDSGAGLSGVMLYAQPEPVPDETLAAVYQQQVLANLSRDIGTIAAQSSTNAMLPEMSGRIKAAHTPAQPEAAEPEAKATLDLPPATVGPLSLRLAAANGDASAQFEVAARLAEGKGTTQDLKEAVRWYQRSASQGFAQAQYRIGTFYERGLDVPKDIRRARVWYQRAAEQGNIKAMHNLAVLAAGESDPDYRTAAAWFSKAAEHGLPDSQYNLGVLYENGLGLQQDRVAAYKWYTLAARGGDKDALDRRDAVKATLSESELKAAEALVSAFVPTPADPLANDARAAGEDWKRRANLESGA